MRAAVFVAPGHVEVRDVADPVIEEPTDAIVAITHAAICGTDLWFWRGINRNWREGWRTGHEFIGRVSAVGSDVRTLNVGDYVIAPFASGCGRCEFCQAGLFSSCVRGGVFGGGSADGGQGEAARVPWADATLVRMSDTFAEDPHNLAAAVLLTDVLPTGYHGCLRAGAKKGSVAAVVGDGAVGLCAVASATLLGCDQVILIGHHPDRLEMGLRLGATDTVDSSAPGAIDRVIEITQGGCRTIIEAVGNQDSMNAAIRIARPGATISYVGSPRQVDTVDLTRIWHENLTLAGALAPVRAHIETLLAAVTEGRIDPTPLLDMRVPLDDITMGFASMDARHAIKVLVEVR